MAIAPLNDDQPNVVVIDATQEPTKTYEFDFATGQFTNRMIDGDEAFRQFVIKAIITPRFRYLIYDEDYGSELEDLLGENLSDSMVESEIQRMVREALIYDDRVSDVTQISVTRQSDKVYISFYVTQTTGEVTLFNEEVVI